MIRKLLATTALATLVASGAYAQDATQPAQTAPAQTAPSTTQAPMSQPETPMVIKAEGNLASNVIGKAVYNGTGEDAKKIGSVNDLVLSPDGQVQALVIGVGGFLGIGQKDVAIEYNLAKWEERDNDRWLVVETTAEALKAQPEFDKQAYQPMPADANVAETKPASAEDLAKAPVAQEPAGDTASTAQQPAASTSTDQTAQAPAASGTTTQDQTAATEQKPADQAASTDQTAQAPAASSGTASQDQTAAADQKPADGQAASGTDRQAAQAPAADSSATDSTQTAAIDRSTLKDQPTDQIRADDFVGTTVYGADDAKVGEVGDVVLSKDGKVDAVLVDVGGFLGMGEKEVALGMDNLHFMTDENGKLYLYTSLTKDALEAQPAYEEGSYADNRDKMRMNVPAAN